MVSEDDMSGRNLINVKIILHFTEYDSAKVIVYHLIGVPVVHSFSKFNRYGEADVSW